MQVTDTVVDSQTTGGTPTTFVRFVVEGGKQYRISTSIKGEFVGLDILTDSGRIRYFVTITD